MPLSVCQFCRIKELFEKERNELLNVISQMGNRIKSLESNKCKCNCKENQLAKIDEKVVMLDQNILTLFINKKANFIIIRKID